jgi:hypothetical protein
MQKHIVDVDKMVSICNLLEKNFLGGNFLRVMSYRIKDPTNFRRNKHPSVTIAMNKTVKLAFASDVIIDKNGVSMKWGRTRGYTIETPEGKVYHGGKTVFCYEEELFEDFVEGLLVAL